jgi:hypothetical protein
LGTRGGRKAFSVRHYIYKEDDLYKLLDKKFKKIIDRLTFDKSLFNENELMFHQITRQPIIKIGNVFFILPELLLDSLFTNTHYSLIESKEVKQKYLSKKSSYFLDKISKLAKEHGYEEIEREKDLFQGKKQIGDIDIIFKNSEKHFLLIEAKDHALPLDVYFKNIEKTNNHLEYLKKEWDKKISRRKKHLEENHKKYDIDKNFTYIAVSKHPEIISHYSNILYLIIREFGEWLKTRKLTENFDEFYNETYSSKQDAGLTIEEIRMLQMDKLLPGMLIEKE